MRRNHASDVPADQALCLRPACALLCVPSYLRTWSKQFAPRLGTAAVSRRGTGGGDAAAPNLILCMAGTRDPPPFVPSSLSLGLSDRPTESTWVPSNCLPACLATVEHKWSACVGRYVYHHCFWDCGLVSNHRRKGSIKHRRTWCVPTRRDPSWPTGYFVATLLPLRRSKFPDSGASAMGASPLSPEMIPPRVQHLTEEIMFMSGL